MMWRIWSLVLMWLISLSTGADVTVTCDFTSDCVLPCKSTHHHVIQWYKAGEENAIHTFSDDEDHVEQQDAAFRGRTSLFTHLISQGNVSLLLRETRVKDEGIYTCYTSSTSEELKIIIRLEVRAPVKKVDMKFTGEVIICNTSDVYPKPIISWYENNNSVLNDNESEAEDEQGLFSLRSTLAYKTNQQSNENRNVYKKQHNIYTCCMSMKDRSQRYTAHLRQEHVDIFMGQDAVIHCPVPRGDPGEHTITLRYKENFTILLSRRANVTQQWAEINLNLTYDGNVTLHNLDMNMHTGNYTCELFTAWSSTEVVQTSVHIISDIHNRGIEEVLSAAVVVMGIGSYMIFCFCGLKRKKEGKSKQKEVDEELEQEVELLSAEIWQ